jgi:RHS repeat-associated protein
MPGRKYSIANTNYRYGFNGKENDNDIENSAQDYGMRIYDGRLGRFLTVDPITAKYPFLTPYQFGSNRPIDGIDLDGLEWAIYSFKAFKKNGQAYVNVHRDAYSNTWIDRIGGAQYWLRPAGSPSGYQGIAFDSFDAMFNAAKRFADGQADYKSAKIAFDEKNLEIFEAIVATNLVINAHDAIDGYVNQKIRAKTNLGILPAPANLSISK